MTIHYEYLHKASSCNVIIVIHNYRDITHRTKGKEKIEKFNQLTLINHIKTGGYKSKWKKIMVPYLYHPYIPIELVHATHVYNKVNAIWI